MRKTAEPNTSRLQLLPPAPFAVGTGGTIVECYETGERYASTWPANEVCYTCPRCGIQKLSHLGRCVCGWLGDWINPTGLLGLLRRTSIRKDPAQL